MLKSLINKKLCKEIKHKNDIFKMCEKQACNLEINKKNCNTIQTDIKVLKEQYYRNKLNECMRNSKKYM